jgi:hypothetical protein
MLRILFAAAATLALCAPAALACAGQTGKVIFEDNFTDDSGGWNLQPPEVEIKNGALFLRLGKFENDLSQNNMFSAGDADYCVEFILPKQVAPDNYVTLGLVFWSPDGNNGFVASAMTDKRVNLARWSSNRTKVDTIFEQPNVAALKLESDAVNALRVIATEGKVTLILNGSQVKVMRAQRPSGELRFGVFAAVSKATDTNLTVQVKSFKVTAGQ